MRIYHSRKPRDFWSAGFAGRWRTERHGRRTGSCAPHRPDPPHAALGALRLRWRAAHQTSSETGEVVASKIKVLAGNLELGHIDSQSQFNYEAAPDERTSLGWAIATGRGKEEVLIDDDSLDVCNICGQ